MLFHEELFTRSQCTYCQQEISGLGIQCAECHNGNFRLCVECFSLGAEIGQHKSDHKYRYFDSGSLVLSSNTTSTASKNDAPKASASATATSTQVSEDPEPVAGTSTGGATTSASTSTSASAVSSESPKWSAREEIRLLDAIEQYGFGNWQDISKHIESKTPAEAKTHYVNRYVNGTLGQLTWATDVSTEVNRNFCNSQIQKPIDHTIPSDEGPLSPSLTQRLPPLEINPEEMLALGYMPQRDDYEKEYDNEAEKLVSQLSFTPDDDELDIGLKLALVDIYTRRLRERARRKRMIRDYQLVSKFFKKDKAKNNGTAEASTSKGQFSAYEKTLQDKFRPFAQFMNSKEHENLIRNLVKEKELKFRLTELYKYRRAGIKRPEECAEYERLKASTAAAVKGKRSLETIPEGEVQDEGRSGNKKAPVAESLVAPLLVRQLQQAIPPNSPKAMPSMSSAGNAESASGSPSVVQSLTQPLFSSEDSNLKSYMESSESVHVLLQPGLLDEPRELEVLLQTNEISSQQSEKLRVSGDLYTAEYAPSSDLLTEKELQFCLKTTITPAQFLTIKTALLLARKPKIDNNQQVMELKDIPCPPNITSDEWEQVITFFKTNYI